MASVVIDRVCKRFGKTDVLSGVSLDVPDGAFVALLGPSGCGKTTLLRIIAGLEAQDSGSISIGGQVVDQLRPRARNIAMVFQSYALYPYMTVAQNVALPLTMRRLSPLQRLPLIGSLLPGTRATRRAIDDDVSKTAAGLDLTHLLKRRPAQLSGGQRQRTALARAMVRNPDVFLMDEPLSNLDAQLRADARGEITALHRRLGATIVYVTHDQTEAMTMADHVVVMRGGHILQAAAPQEIYDDPASLAVARFIGTVKLNEFPAELLRGGELRIGAHVVHVSAHGSADGPVIVGVRAEDMRIVPAKHGLAARVRRLDRHGSDTMLHVDVDGLNVSAILRLTPQEADRYAPDAPLHIAPLAARAMLFNADGARIVAEISDVAAAPSLVRA